MWLRSFYVVSHEKELSEVVGAPPWLKVAEKEIGTKEVMNGENPRIIEYHMVTTLKATTDEIAWCSSFACWCLEQAGIKSTRSAWARHFMSWGETLNTPKPGCVVVFKRGDGGHVGFFISEDKDSILVLGGNQNNSVNISEFWIRSYKNVLFLFKNRYNMSEYHIIILNFRINRRISIH